MELCYHTYIYLDPRKSGKYCYEGLNFSLLYEPFYVGKGKKNRHLDHIRNRNRDTNKLKSRKIIKIISENYNMKEFILIYGNNLPDFCAKSCERFLIKSMGRYDLKLGSLTNLTDGGEGTLNFKPTQETKKKMVLNRYNPILIESRRIKALLPKTKLVYTEETKNKMKIGRELAKKNIPCIICGKIFGAQQSQWKCCSKECRETLYLKNNFPEIQCPICGKSFYKEFESKITCSRSCHFINMREKSTRNKMIPCVVCGKEHISFRKSCSKSCGAILGHKKRNTLVPP